MNHMTPFSTDQWMQQYQNTTSGHTTTIASGADKDSGQGNASSQQAQASGGKTTRRRSRASRKTPTTLLKASPTDFRALVQQFTGYHGGNESSSSAGKPPKGPMNINFAQNDTTERSRYGYYSNNQQSLPLRVQQHQDMQPVGGLGVADLPDHGMDNVFMDHQELADESSFDRSGPDGGYYY